MVFTRYAACSAAPGWWPKRRVGTRSTQETSPRPPMRAWPPTRARRRREPGDARPGPGSLTVNSREGGGLSAAPGLPAIGRHVAVRYGDPCHWIEIDLCPGCSCEPATEKGRDPCSMGRPYASEGDAVPDLTLLVGAGLAPPGGLVGREAPDRSPNIPIYPGISRINAVRRDLLVCTHWNRASCEDRWVCPGDGGEAIALNSEEQPLEMRQMGGCRTCQEPPFAFPEVAQNFVHWSMSARRFSIRVERA